MAMEIVFNEPVTQAEYDHLTAYLELLRKPNPTTPELLARAVVEGDYTAARGLADWLVEEVAEGKGGREEFVGLLRLVGRTQGVVPRWREWAWRLLGEGCRACVSRGGKWILLGEWEPCAECEGYGSMQELERVRLVYEGVVEQYRSQ
jgi:hypothetical protein